MKTLLIYSVASIIIQEINAWIEPHDHKIVYDRIPNIRPNIRPGSAEIIRPNIRPTWPKRRIPKKRRFLVNFT